MEIKYAYLPMATGDHSAFAVTRAISLGVERSLVPQFNLENGVELEASLQDFVSCANQGEFNKWMHKHKRRKEDIDKDIHFKVKATTTGYCHESENVFQNHDQKIYDASFYRDGTHGILFGLEDVAEPGHYLPLGMTSIISPHVIKKYNRNLNTIDTPMPIIVQLQGTAEWNFKGRDKQKRLKKASTIREKVQWEYVMTHFYAEWARKNKFSHLGILPAEKNYYWDDQATEDVKARYRRRYNRTAEIYGFEYSNNGLYVLDLSYQTKQ